MTPCPFCSSTDIVEIRDHIQTWSYGERIESWAECRTCGAREPLSAEVGPGQWDRVATWDDRTGVA